LIWKEAKIAGRARGRIAAVRGAITVPANRAPAIRRATARLLRELMTRNRLEPSRIVSALFTSTPDLDADFPAHAARRMGWKNVPMLGALEVGVRGGLPRVIRVLLLVDGVRPGVSLTPAYLEGAARLRPDWAKKPRRTSRPRPVRTIAIIGLGQIGGSIGLALAGHPSWRRIGFDLDQRVSALARRSDAIDDVASALGAALRHADLAVLAVPVDRLPRLIDRAGRLLPEGAVLLDMGSARTFLTPSLRRVRRVKAVGGHPIAGNEGRGFASARADLFRDAPFVFWPEPPAIVRDLVGDLGARPLIVAPDRHDRALARTSHLPYLIARSLARAGSAHAAAGLSGPSFRDITRVAASDPKMAMAYVRANKKEVARAWKEVRREIDRLVRQAVR
jgi:monofunctional chorismate mutase